MHLTRREKRVLIAALVIGIFFVIVRPSHETVMNWEYFFLFFVVAPIGFYIATDRERWKTKK